MDVMNLRPESHAVLLRGGYGLGNLGDDVLMLLATQAVAQATGRQPVVVSSRNAAYVQRMLTGVTVVSPDQANKLSPSMVVYGGGTQFYSHLSNRALLLHKLLRFPAKLLRDPTGTLRTLRKIAQGAALGTRYSVDAHTACIGIGIGPLAPNSSETLHMRDVFRAMEFIAVRDQISMDILGNWGVDRGLLCADLCYTAGLPGASMFQVAAARGRIQNVAIVIRDWPRPYLQKHDRHWKPLLTVARDLRTRGKTVQFISFRAKGDVVWASRLRKAGESLLSWDSETGRVEDFVRQLSVFDCTITSRYHAAVFASLFGRPSICVGLDLKLEAAVADLGRGARLWSYPYRADDCLAALDDIEADYGGCVEALGHEVRRQTDLNRVLLDRFSAYAGDCFRT